MRDGALQTLRETRALRPEAILEAAQRRSRRPMVQPSGRLMLVAADHPARGALTVRGRPDAMANRAELLDRLLTALERPGVDGVLGTPDVLEDLLLLGALEDKVVIGSMNRGGVPETVFEMDDRFTAYDAASIEEMGFNAGKMLLRIDPADAATASTLAGCADAVSALADRRLTALVEPFWVRRGPDGRAVNDLRPEAMTRALAIAQGLGRTSAYTWLKVPVVDHMEAVMEASTLPALLLGGDPPGTPDETYASWEKALRLPTVRGLVVGRSLLYPPDDDVAAAVDTAVGLL
ncbi:Cgl0159 family (beta/alpha)8-fold protein [Streptomyces sp. NBC_00385]|uniref:Cgl0159 family (beta/alpha)8-fold protein n=1 Tax=Streptomyces sp. NBC_00385 TaxID=2975733 RepID=UPI002DD950C1|nr:deoxyribose-phosphate aldolase [Streptomyces sp. NBC_00385]WRZ05845.1 deoxyribose-phosphate aldolase [Streptomyces sp. NBC_00385]